MATQRYSVTPHPVDTLLAWVKSGDIAIPEIQRPFVWDATKVRNLLDSLYQGYPVGYLISWRNPTVKLKDGSHSAGKRVLIDGQQRVTALMASLLGREVLTKDYETVRIRIAFHPGEERFEVHNPAIARDAAWIDDVSVFFGPDADLIELIDQYFTQNPTTDRKTISRILQKVGKIVNNHVGLIELAEDLDIETVTEIFIRVNSAGAVLSQADFAMSKIAVDEKFGGNLLRKAIDYFCHLAVAPEYFSKIEKGDPNFAQSEFLPKMRWLKDINDDLYDPTYTDMLRVAFTSEFGRGKLQDLVALLSGRNFETREYEEAITEKSFAQLKSGIDAFMSKTHFDRLTMILRSAGFITSALIRSRNAVNFAYILYLRGRKENLPANDIEHVVRRWYAMSVLTGRYSGSPETTFDVDIRQITDRGVKAYTETVIENELPDTFWTGMLLQEMDTSSAISPYFIAYQAAQVNLGDKGFLSTDITVRDLLISRGDKHHVFPRKYLQRQGLNRGRYNQIANFVIAQSEINIAIGDKAPEEYFRALAEQCNGGKKYYGGITNEAEMRANLAANCIPDNMLDGGSFDYEDFLAERRRLMALKIKQWVEEMS
ncbi:GmrSD restriction endonuclease domain-containing protein [Candidatus Spongiihabitans sp.]|uniref:GmrSD restriction endonuclease domain-containing protein n=1 Tax=Candidatus Spongiihabitans sp. TaxID=3101308 RepID=UPI003C7CC04B